MTEAKIAGQFDITWKYGAYRVSIPNYYGGSVVPAEVGQEMLAVLQRVLSAFEAPTEWSSKMAREMSSVRTAIAKATGAE